MRGEDGRRGRLLEATMSSTLVPTRAPADPLPAAPVGTMRAAVFVHPGVVEVREAPRPRPGPGEAVIRVTLTTIGGTDVHLLKGEYPVRAGLVIGHEPVGVITELGAGLDDLESGERVLVGAIPPCGQCLACLGDRPAQRRHGGTYEALGGWRFGSTIDAPA